MALQSVINNAICLKPNILMIIWGTSIQYRNRTRFIFWMHFILKNTSILETFWIKTCSLLLYFSYCTNIITRMYIPGHATVTLHLPSGPKRNRRLYYRYLYIFFVNTYHKTPYRNFKDAWATHILQIDVILSWSIRFINCNRSLQVVQVHLCRCSYKVITNELLSPAMN